MKKSIFWPFTILFVVFVVSLGSICYAVDIKKETNQTFLQNDLKKMCLSATITAIKLEMNRHQQWIDSRKQQGDQKDLTQLQGSLNVLKADLEKYLAMDAKDYVLPEKVEVVAWVGDKAGKDSILYMDGMSKSGPWYHLAGIKGDDYAILQPNTKYRMNFYSVYPRSYWGMNSAYICISNVEGSNEGVPQQQSQGKKIMGEVFMYKYNGPLNDLVKCEDYQIYLLKEMRSGSEGELIVDSKKSRFEFILSEEKLKKYSYLEFVSAYGNKTIKLNELENDKLKIILERDMVLKKPAIYLYPSQKSQILITHQFKGKILNTYPIYTDGWVVIAEPNGNLLNIKDKRYYKYIFWDGVYAFSGEHYQFKSGFYVKREDYVSFLQSKLGTIGLNDNEINDFIVYWLPTMSKHKNCFIHFRINDDIDGSSVLETKPEAETVIRVFMEFSRVDDINSVPKLPEQNLPAFTRKGFTLVEWGGAEFGSNKIE